MKKYYYRKSQKLHKKKLFRILGLSISFFGIFGIIYIFFPFISWHLYFSPAFASQDIQAPIPTNTVINSETLKSLIVSSAQNLAGVDYTNAANWFPSVKLDGKTPKVTNYNLSIPKIGIKNALVSTTDYDLSNHLINYSGTAIPPENGSAVIFGHSTLPQLFNPDDYKTIFANAYKLKIDDQIIVTISTVSYTYIIYNISVIDADDPSAFTQIFDNSYITLVTCTPPGTVWKRLIVRARMQKL